ncbi:hypothetical protein GC194_07795 [bacterium]|nr:hypothetical protein [bacterium]
MNAIDDKWPLVIEFLKGKFQEKQPDVKSVLFVLGLRELGKRQTEFSKEAKMDLMNIGFCKICSLSGYFETEGNDADGWPLWKQVKPLPKMTTKEQEKFIKEHVVKYFEAEAFI